MAKMVEQLGPQTRRSHSLPTLLKVCVGLGFLATAAFNLVVGDMQPMNDKATAHRAFEDFVDVMSCQEIMNFYIKFVDTNANMAKRKTELYMYGKLERK